MCVNYYVSQGATLDGGGLIGGETALHQVAQWTKNVDLLTYLVALGADINKKDQWDQTPLLYAARENENLDILKFFVDQGADPNAKNKYGESPIRFAAEQNKNAKIIEFLIEKGADVNERSAVYKGGTPLHFAAAHNENVEVLKILLANGADVNAKRYDDVTPLYLAASYNPNVEVAKYLVSQGADKNVKYNSFNLLDAASENANAEVAKFLESEGIDERVDVFAKIKYYWTGFSGLIVALIGVIGAIIGSIIGCYHSIKKAKWWLPHAFIFCFIIYCLVYRLISSPHYNYGPEGLLPIIGLAVVGSFILSLGWLVSWVWLLCHKCWKKALASVGLWLLVGGLQMVWFIGSLISNSFQYFFWLPFPPL
ncbi:MAG: ankyrin repeat domain-containing protein [Kiritimatiellaeota bacterium]|nr:ankyrin repeat domain-containing protein [Kiritimatiellota bacterium]